MPTTPSHQPKRMTVYIERANGDKGPHFDLPVYNVEDESTAALRQDKREQTAQIDSLVVFLNPKDGNFFIFNSYAYQIDIPNSPNSNLMIKGDPEPLIRFNKVPDWNADFGFHLQTTPPGQYANNPLISELIKSIESALANPNHKPFKFPTERRGEAIATYRDRWFKEPPTAAPVVVKVQPCCAIS